MTEQDRHNSGCNNKRKLNERDAKDEARRVSVRTGERVQAYECDFCPHWHIGHAVSKRLR
jgi:hypothetical protein